MCTNLRFKITLIIILSVLFICAHSNEILDFQYTQYTQLLDQNHQYPELNIEPVDLSSNKLKFPEVCNLIDFLNEPIKQGQNKGESSDVDAYLNETKQKFLQLLTLAQKLANSQDKILHFQILINQTNPIIPNENQINQIEQYQKKLKNLTQRIQYLDNLLQTNISVIDGQNTDYHLNQVKRIELDFKSDWLKQKVNYLKNFEQKARIAIQKSIPDINYSRYFTDLEDGFNNESKLISQIEIIIQKKDKLSILKKQKANFQSSINALEIYIKDIKQCNDQKENMKKQFKNHQKINQLILQLKQLKKNQQPNTYCQGVVKKLTQKIKAMVRYYSIVSSCASDLDAKNADLEKQKIKLNHVKANISKLESLDDMEDFQKTYNEQKQVIQKMYLKVRDWKMKQFIHDPQKIVELRDQAQAELNEVLAQKQAYKKIMSGEPAQERKKVSNNIIDLIKQIRSLKYEYCGIYQKYDSLSNRLWSETYRYESEVELKNKLYKMHRDEKIASENMFREMIELRQKIYQHLKRTSTTIS